jgi:spermidine/putrescine transport system ATP-binding protein
MGTAVDLNNVSKAFGAVAAVKNLSLAVREGEFLTLLGPSGCGKTTTLRLVNGFEVPDEGTVSIGGHVVNAVPPYRRNVNTVFQSYALFPHLTVFENIAYGLTLKRVPRATTRKRVLEMLERVDLVDKAASMPRQLSGGQMQRIALARALINEPSVLLLDEPLGSLDAKLRKAMQLELKHVHGSLRITFIYVTHDQEEALVMSDRIAVMSGGRIAQLGSPDAVFERPNNRFVAEFIGTANFLSGRIAEASASSRRIALDHGPVWSSTAPSDAKAGDKVTVAVRPQKIRVAPPTGAQEACNGAYAVLREIVYVGAWIRLVLELRPGVLLVVENTPDGLAFDYRALRPGDELLVEVPPEAILLFREGGG